MKMIAFLLIFFAVCVFLLLMQMVRFYRTVYVIPSPPEYPVIGSFLHFLANPERLFDKVRKFSAAYYPIYRLSTFFFSVVVLLDPNDIEIVLSSTKHISKSRVYTYLNRWLGTGLLTSTGVKWHNRRKVLTPAFHYDILQKFVVVFNQETEKLVARLEQECEKSSFNIIPIATNFTLRSLGETAMGFNDISEEQLLKYKDAIYRMGELLLKRLSVPWFHIQPVYDLSALGRKEKATVKTLKDFTNKIIVEREKDFETKNGATKKRRMAMLDLLLTAKREGANIDGEGIREEVNTFMFEGHDTAAMAISFILLTLAHEREVQEKMVAEILDVLGPTQSPTMHDLQTLKYTERCIKECLRLFPSVPFISRRIGEDFWTKTGYFIPKNTIVHIHIFDVHRSPVLYPDPLKFDPDRFLPENVSNRHPFAYIPFSAGPRNCIGQKFALLELKAAVCGVLRNFVLEPVDSMFDVKFKPDLILRPRSEIKIRVKRRLL